MAKCLTSLVLTLLLLLPAVLPAAGQGGAASQRPKVGLVLSGGGARGFAHIGVLKVLEENRVPVDYVGGASIGGLIGALYAMGYSPAEIEDLISTLDWDRLFAASTSYDNLSFRRKEDRKNIPGPIPLRGKPTNPRLPSAFNSGHEIGILFDRVTLPYAATGDFDDLPIPFATVATNMVNGNSEVLDSGSLSRSLRATMSIPGVFAPIEIDGKILADGGLVNNIPTNVVKAMGADILLVINIETQLASREDLENLIGVLAQTINIATMENSRRSLREADIIIAPDLQDYTSTSFASSPELIELGYQGAKAREMLLRGLSLSEPEWEAHLAARSARKAAETPPVPDSMAIESSDPDAKSIIEDRLGDRYVGVPLDEAAKEALTADLSELTGTGRFEALNYGLVSENGRTVLVIKTNERNGRPSDPTRIDVGFDVNSFESEDVGFNVLARLTYFDVGRYGAEWRNDLRVGSNTLLASEYFRPIGSAGLFVAPRVSFERRNVNFFDGGQRISEYNISTSQASIDMGFTFNTRSELRAGYAIGYEVASRRIGEELLPDRKGRFSAASLRWTYDGLDQSQIPKSGLYSRNSLTYNFEFPGSDGGFTQGETRHIGFTPFNENNTLFAFGGAGTSFGSTAPALRQFTLGGPFRLGGYGVDEFRASNYIHAGAGVLHSRQILPRIFGGRAYVGAWYEGGTAFERFGDAEYRQSLSGGVIVETPLGPIMVGGGVNENFRGRFFFSFGRFIR